MVLSSHAEVSGVVLSSHAEVSVIALSSSLSHTEVRGGGSSVIFRICPVPMSVMGVAPSSLLSHTKVSGGGSSIIMAVPYRVCSTSHT